MLGSSADTTTTSDALAELFASHPGSATPMRITPAESWRLSSAPMYGSVMVPSCLAVSKWDVGRLWQRVRWLQKMLSRTLSWAAIRHVPCLFALEDPIGHSTRD